MLDARGADHVTGLVSQRVQLLLLLGTHVVGERGLKLGESLGIDLADVADGLCRKVLEGVVAHGNTYDLGTRELGLVLTDLRDEVPRQIFFDEDRPPARRFGLVANASATYTGIETRTLLRIEPEDVRQFRPGIARLLRNSFAWVDGSRARHHKPGGHVEVVCRSA